MKVLFIYLLLLVCSMAFLLFVDILSGMDVATALFIIQGGLAVTAYSEQLLILVMFVLPIIGPAAAWYKQRSRKKQS